jgi:hypothetical protein
LIRFQIRRTVQLAAREKEILVELLHRAALRHEAAAAFPEDAACVGSMMRPVAISDAPHQTAGCY